MKEYRITANIDKGVLNDKTFDNAILLQLEPLYRQIAKNQRLPSVERVVIDLQGVRYANPYGALGVVVLCEILCEIFKQKVDLILPGYDDEVFLTFDSLDEFDAVNLYDGIEFSCWMNSLGFLNVIEGFANIKGYSPSPHANSNPNFIPVTRINTLDDVYSTVDEMIEKVQPLLVGKLGYSQEETFRFITIMSELCQNIYYHSAPKGNPYGYIAMQAYEKNIKFAVMDLGVGIPTTLKPKYQISDDREAIRLALKPRVTSKEEGGGLGLYRTVEIVSQVGGFLNIRSGTAKVLITPMRKYYAGGKIYSSFVYFWGTQIGILLPRKK